LFRVRAVEPPNTRLSQDLGWHQASIHAHAVICPVDGRPMRNATAVSTAVKFDRAVVPHVHIRPVRTGGNSYQLRRIIRPQHAITATDRTVAVYHRLRCLWQEVSIIQGSPRLMSAEYCRKFGRNARPAQSSDSLADFCAVPDAAPVSNLLATRVTCSGGLRKSPCLKPAAIFRPSRT
jgi:hypothetical protein